MSDPIIKITDILRRLGIPYCLIGGYAVAVHGVPRFTADVDLLIAPLEGQMAALRELLQEASLPSELNKADLLDPLGDVLTVFLETPVQLICAKYKYHFAAIERARPLAYAGSSLQVVQPEDLIILKLKGGSYKDLWDVENILSSRDDLDRQYLLDAAKGARVNRRLQAMLRKIGQGQPNA